MFEQKQKTKTPPKRGFRQRPHALGVGACVSRRSGFGDDADGTTLLRALDRELHLAVDEREQGVVTAEANAATRVELGAALTHDDVAASMAWPPKILTPRYFGLESRPLREEPTPFLCAMTGSPYYLLPPAMPVISISV